MQALTQALPDPVAIALVGIVALLGYWFLHWYITRPRLGVFGAVGRRPEIGRASEFGEMSEVDIGTYGAREGNVVARAMVRANVHSQVGAKIVFELSEKHRREVWQEIPHELPRVAWGGSPFFKNGVGHQPMDVVGQPAMRAKWAFDLKQTVNDLCAAVRRPAFLAYTPLGVFIQPALNPSTIWILVSPGGHLLLAIEAARLLRQRFEHADFYAATILADESYQREELMKAVELHAADPIFRFWLVTDNRLDRATNDRAVALLVACLMQAHRVSSQAQDAYNLLRTLYTQGDGRGVAVPRYWEREVAVYPTPLPPIDFFISRDDAVNAVLDGIYALSRPDGGTHPPAYRGIGLNTHLDGSRRYIVVNIALRRPYLDNLESEIRDRLKEEGWFLRDPHRSLIFASLGEDLSRSSRWVTVSVMALEMATDGIEGLQQLVASEAATRPAGQRRDGAPEQQTATSRSAPASGDKTDHAAIVGGIPKEDRHAR